MKVSYEWLKELTDIKISAEEIAEKITMSGLEVEKIEKYGIGKQNVVVVEILEVKNHPSSNNLFVAKVDAGNFGVKQIVTNVKDIYVGQKTLAALDGVRLANGLTIKKTEIKGVLSEGMFVGWEEIGANYKSDALFTLDKSIKNGSFYYEIFPINDSVINIELTANRGDCLSMLGVAREIKGIFGCNLSGLTTEYNTIDKDVNEIFKVKIETKNCLRYCGAVILDVKIEPSPYWMQLRLIKAGIRPINNVVDITNYILLECNQPLHAFDMDKINNHTIIVRNAKDDEKIKTLDGIERSLNSNDMVIADPIMGHCLAGVMGGEISEVTDNTKNIFLEAAYFKPECIRTTSKKLDLRSESSYRFERGIDLDQVDWAIKRALYWFDKLNVGRICKGIIDVYPVKKEKKVITVTSEWINNKLGSNIPEKEIVSILERLSFNVKKENNTLILTVPSWRNDISIKEDISEEIGRIYGYNNIKPTHYPSVSPGVRTLKQKFEKEIRELLYKLGCDQVMNFSLYGKSLFNKMLLPENHEYRNIIYLQEPLTDEWAGFRNSLIPGMIKTASFNSTHQNKNLALFEIGIVANKKEKNICEEKRLSVLLAGNKYDKDYTTRELKYDYYDIKGIIDQFFEYLKLEPEFKPLNEVYFQPYQQAEVYCKNEKIGLFGKVHPLVCEKFDIDVDCFVMELSIDKMFELYVPETKYSDIPKFPSSTRDIAILLDDNIIAKTVIDTIKSTNLDILKEIKIFDIYKGENIPEGKYSMALSLTFNKGVSTLLDAEVDEAVNKILDVLNKKLSAKIR